MADIKPRYEFRIWGRSLADVRDKLQQSAAPSRIESSRETYLISAATERCNAKIRNNLMDIKILIGTERGLEQWRPVLKAGFPLDRAVIDGEIFSALELPAPALSRTQYGLDEFLAEAIGAQPSVAVVAVAKTRAQFSLDQCQAEFTSVTIDAVTPDTVAVEAADADAVLRLIRRLGIESAPNTSYIRQIKRILGERP